MNSFKSYIPVIISLIISSFIIFIFSLNHHEDTHLTKEVYNVYLDGKYIGSIKSKVALEKYIDKEQIKLKKEYNVDKIYVPNGIDIEKSVTHNSKLTSVKKIYNKIKVKKGFTIKGYVVTIEENKKEIKLNLLKKNLFDKAANIIVKNFVKENDIKNYKNNTQPEIKTTGSIIENISIAQNVTIKESFISTEEQIYSDVDSLVKYLLFNDSDTNKEYIVKPGDTIETVSFNNKLSTDEFLIVNPEFTNSKNLLSPGQKVNIALINPVLKISVEKHIVEDMDKPFETVEKSDPNMTVGMSKVETEGVNGVQRVTEKIKYVNGEVLQSVIVKSDILKQPINKVVVKGTSSGGSYSGSYSGSGTYLETAGKWGWPTVTPYILESTFKWRWGRLHEGIDLCAGSGSPIYAARAGVVVSTNQGCPSPGGYSSRCGGGYGNYVIINHGDGMYSIYGHMLNGIRVSQGQTVSRGQVLGGMGSSGSSTGTHLHYGIYYGVPMRGGKPINPLTVY